MRWQGNSNGEASPVLSIRRGEQGKMEDGEAGGKLSLKERRGPTVLGKQGGQGVCIYPPSPGCFTVKRICITGVQYSHTCVHVCILRYLLEGYGAKRDGQREEQEVYKLSTGKAIAQFIETCDRYGEVIVCQVAET